MNLCLEDSRLHVPLGRRQEVGERGGGREGEESGIGQTAISGAEAGGGDVEGATKGGESALAESLCPARVPVEARAFPEVAREASHRWGPLQRAHLRETNTAGAGMEQSCR